MHATSPLHWRIRKDNRGIVMVQNRLTSHDDSMWGEMFLGWTNAPRPDDREFDADTSGMHASDLKIAPPKPMLPVRSAEIAKCMKAVAARLTPAENEAFDGLLDELANPAATRAPQPNRWTFRCECGDGDSDDEDLDGFIFEEDQKVNMPPVNIFNNPREQDAARQARRADVEDDATDARVGDYVAYTTHYTAETPLSQQHDFWVGRLTAIEGEQVEIRCFHTSAMKNLTTSCKYKAWMARPQYTWLDTSRLLKKVEFNTNNCIVSATRKRIGNALATHAADAR
jgi:hypothetical protein